MGGRLWSLLVLVTLLGETVTGLDVDGINIIGLGKTIVVPEKEVTVQLAEAGQGTTTSTTSTADMLRDASERYLSSMESAWSQMRSDPVALLTKVGRTFLEPHEDFVLFRQEDSDNVVLTLGQAMKYVLFYMLIAAAFGAHIYFVKGVEAASMWFSGYILEWMLSIDNFFIFRMIFDIYGTPDKLKHKPLFYGIIGAIFFRMIFFVVGEALMHTIHFMHIVFGSFLIYTGMHVATDDEEDSNPTENSLIVYLSSVIPVVNGYDEDGSFFVRVRRDHATGELIYPKESRTLCIHVNKKVDSSSDDDETTPRRADLKVWESDWYVTPSTTTTSRSSSTICSSGNLHNDELLTSTSVDDDDDTNSSSTNDNIVCSNIITSTKETSSTGSNILIPSTCSKSKSRGDWGYETRFTFLFIVVICLEITDLMFAVDSVSAIVAQVPDLYLAYTACIFAMLGLRATFFVVDELIRMFHYLKYGVAFMLVFIGVKLILSKVVHISAALVCAVLCSTLFVCMSLSLLRNRQKRIKKASSHSITNKSYGSTQAV